MCSTVHSTMYTGIPGELGINGMYVLNMTNLHKWVMGQVAPHPSRSLAPDLEMSDRGRVAPEPHP